jgi:RimJ/RimL family protein N-acetyltransferase
MLQNLTLLRLHVEAVWHVQLPAQLTREVDVLREGFQPSWKLCVAEIDEGCVHIWRPDTSPAEREALRIRTDEALAFSPLSPPDMPLPGVSREVAFSQIAAPHIDSETARRTARLLTPLDRSLLEVFYEGASDASIQPEERPLVGVVRDGRLLSLALSARRTAKVCELGIETHPTARRQGLALAATILWTEMVRQEGLIPLYSALAENTASLHLAQAAGYRPFARAAVFKEKE